MPEAFVLMNAELGSEESIVNELKKIRRIKIKKMRKMIIKRNANIVT